MGFVKHCNNEFFVVTRENYIYCFVLKLFSGFILTVYDFILISTLFWLLKL